MIGMSVLTLFSSASYCEQYLGVGHYSVNHLASALRAFLRRRITRKVLCQMLMFTCAKSTHAASLLGCIYSDHPIGDRPKRPICSATLEKILRSRG